MSDVYLFHPDQSDVCTLSGWLTDDSPRHASSSAASSRAVWTAASSPPLPVAAAPPPPSWPSQQPFWPASVSSSLGCGSLKGQCQEPGNLNVLNYNHVREDAETEDGNR